MKSSGLVLVMVAAAGFAAAAHSVKAEVTSTQTSSDIVLVQAALNRFDSALASHDAAQLAAVGIKPGNVREWRSFFKNPGASVTDSCPASALFITGETASWDCSETASVNFGGKTATHVQTIRFLFVRKDGEWAIADRR